MICKRNSYYKGYYVVNFGIIITFLAFLGGFDITLVSGTGVCKNSFDGFGIHLGSIHHLNSTNEATVEVVMDKMYHQLQLRHFRTSYEPYFSPSENVYNISCNSASGVDCTWVWEKLLEIMSRPPYNTDTNFIASIWSPPYYMKNSLFQLKREYETAYLHYIRNITDLIQNIYGIEIEKISPVNEPENAFASWDHTNMDASQLCRMIKEWNDPKISICTENSYFWITQIYTSYNNPIQKISCLDSCSIIATHSYALNLNPNSSDFLSAYYDLRPCNVEGTLLESKEIWQTEVCSTYRGANLVQMDEGLDLATNIINFIGTTCVSRYYFWYPFTTWISGESLIWGSPPSGGDDQQLWDLVFPKKYWIYNHFTNASFAAKANAADKGEIIHVEPCSKVEFSNGAPPMTSCLKFDARNIVFVNKEELHVDLNPSNVDCSLGLCCTNESSDLHCEPSQGRNFYTLPARSVCTCKGTGEFMTPTTPQTTTITVTSDSEFTSTFKSSSTTTENDRSFSMKKSSNFSYIMYYIQIVFFTFLLW